MTHLIDVARISIYRGALLRGGSALLEAGVAGAVAVATASAFAGAFIGVRLLGKVTLRGVRRLVGALLCLLGAALALGWI